MTASGPGSAVDGNAPALTVRGLRVALPSGADRAAAVDGPDFEVGRGEVLCLVGESGSGKSVIAQAVMGLLPKTLVRTGGRIVLAGEDITEASHERLSQLRCARMSMVFQEPMTALNPVMRCGAQIDEVLRFHTTLDAAARRDRVRQVIEEVRLPDPQRVVDSYPHQLSGGQRQRIMIAMALVLDPLLLIADEPTTALDVTTQKQILSLIRDLQREHGTGVLFITHDFGVVSEIADRVAVMRAGRMVENRPAAELFAAPAHEYTRMLIDAVPALAPRVRDTDPAAPVVLETRGLGKTYVGAGLPWRRHEVPAATGVDLEIRRGQTLGIVGESGSGKSTVARCIARLIDPTSGAILLRGEDIAKRSHAQLRPMRRKVQVVFQDPYRSLNPRRRVGDSIIEGPLNFGTSRPDALARARRLLEMVRMDPKALDRYPHQFSGGQRQRLCIARALAMEPDLLIADEAVSALDVSVQAQVLELLDEIRGELDLAMLFITHDLRVAAQVCDRIAVMSRGKVVEYGDTAAVFAAPKDPYTQALLAAAPGRHQRFGARAGDGRAGERTVPGPQA